MEVSSVVVVEVVKGKLSGGWKSLSGEVGWPLLDELLLQAVTVLRWRGSGRRKNGGGSGGAVLWRRRWWW